MAGTVDKKLAELRITLPTPASPVANYIPFVRVGSLLFVSGQICLDTAGKLVAKGKLGETVSVEDGQKAARACAINILAQVKAALGDLDKVVRVVRLGGFINSEPTFLDGPKVMNGASDLIVQAFGDKGRHAHRRAGMPSLVAEHRHHEVGGAVHHLRTIEKRRIGIDEAAQARHLLDLVEIAERGLDLR